MAILIDPPSWPGHGRMWSHLVSNSSYDELHVFARTQGLPERLFERDHYDVPDRMFQLLVTAGATPVSSKELVHALIISGLRVRKHAR